MSYASNDAAQSIALVKRTLAGVATFSGRSRRSEFGYYWIATMLLHFVVNLGAGFLSWRGGELFVVAAGWIAFIPFPALFARRLHDQDRAGWWTMLLLPVFILSNYNNMRFMLRDPQTGSIPLPAEPWWVTSVGFALVLTIIVFLVIPGTNGANRHGEDPRLQ
jgi:uncharacterized membrane protein YhaH (DUF805 family)